MAIKSKTIALAEKLWAEGVPVKRIAELCGVYEYEIMNYAVTHRDSFPARRRVSRLTDEQKRRIVELHESGLGPSEIARRVGCHPNTVFRLRST